jgi:hypothetical protein
MWEDGIHTDSTPLPKTLSQSRAPALKQGAKELSQNVKALIQKAKESAQEVLQTSRGMVVQGAAKATEGATKVTTGAVAGSKALMQRAKESAQDVPQDTRKVAVQGAAIATVGAVAVCKHKHRRARAVQKGSMFYTDPGHSGHRSEVIWDLSCMQVTWKGSEAHGAFLFSLITIYPN